MPATYNGLAAITAANVRGATSSLEMRPNRSFLNDETVRLPITPVVVTAWSGLGAGPVWA